MKTKKPETDTRKDPRWIAGLAKRESLEADLKDARAAFHQHNEADEKTAAVSRDVPHRLRGEPLEGPYSQNTLAGLRHSVTVAEDALDSHRREMFDLELNLTRQAAEQLAPEIRARIEDSLTAARELQERLLAQQRFLDETCRKNHLRRDSLPAWFHMQRSEIHILTVLGTLISERQNGLEQLSEKRKAV